MVTIQNSTFHNVSSFKSGGAVYILSQSHNHLHVLNRRQKFFVRLRIINSFFYNITSRQNGGALCVIAEKLLAIVRDSLFVGCNATFLSGAVFIITYDDTTLRLHNDYFLENTAGNGGIVFARSLREESSLNISITNVILFAKNILCTSVAYAIIYGVVTILSRSTKINVSFKDTQFVRNIGRPGGCIRTYFTPSTLHSVTLDACLFKENTGSLGAVFVEGQTSLAVKNSIFDSNGAIPPSRRIATVFLRLNDSWVFIMNTTFVNNFLQHNFFKFGQNEFLFKNIRLQVCSQQKHT